eukprot:XP_011660670.1 PREDICTED: MAM and LDL-receptor class A domain-containing protein 1-like [Strongylocentrotus purpuratus]
MYGAELGFLNVYTQEMATGLRENIWTKNNNQGNAWILAEIDTSIAPPTTAPTRPPVTITPLQWDCTFEDSTLCTWTQGTNNDMDWIIQTGSTPTVGTGPPADHTTQTQEGHYIVIDASSTNADEVARIYSEPIPTGSQMCITYWYHMYGAHVGTLNVGYGNTDGNEEGPVFGPKSGATEFNMGVGGV